jgi:hypothetical protein
VPRWLKIGLIALGALWLFVLLFSFVIVKVF